MFGDAIYQRLAGFAELTALVGNRIYPGDAGSKPVRPYVVFYEQAPIDAAPEMNEPGNMVQTRVQVDAWADDVTTAKRVGDQARAALRNYSGSIAGIEIADVVADGGFDDDDTESGPRLFRRSRDFLITWYEEI